MGNDALHAFGRRSTDDRQDAAALRQTFEDHLDRMIGMRVHEGISDDRGQRIVGLCRCTPLVELFPGHDAGKPIGRADQVSRASCSFDHSHACSSDMAGDTNSASARMTCWAVVVAGAWPAARVASGSWDRTSSTSSLVFLESFTSGGSWRR